jgi:hypothetical protein
MRSFKINTLHQIKTKLDDLIKRRMGKTGSMHEMAEKSIQNVVVQT